jgi:plastocyanin
MRALALLGLIGCGRPDAPDNQVQFSSTAQPSWFVSVSAESGFVPECKTVDVGDTVQWENQDPDIPANVTSLDEPPQMYSPNLQGGYTTWAHTFSDAGFFAYYDTNSGDPGRRVVDAYYGTVTYVGVSETTHLGAVCVPGGDVNCCCTNLDCGSGESCSANSCVPD